MFCDYAIKIRLSLIINNNNPKLYGRGISIIKILNINNNINYLITT